MTVYGTTKKRVYPFLPTTRGVQSLVTSSGSQITNTDSFVYGKQETYSWENPLWTARGKKHFPKALKDWDAGGEFYTVRNDYSGSHPFVMLRNNSSNLLDYRYNGPLFAMANAVRSDSYLWPTVPGDLRNELIAKGTTAIANVLPTNPVAGAAQILGELREGIPKVPLASLGKPGRVSKKFGDEYLNYQFGIAPAVKDFRDIAKAVKGSNKILKQLERDSGRRIRRRYDFPVETSVESSVVSESAYPSPGVYGNLYSKSGRLTKTRETTRRLWFSGAFTYHFETGDSLRDKMVRAEQSSAKLFGTRVTPELFWELTPWSWAVDWVTNLGDVIHNVSAFSRDGLVMPYGYMMATITIKDTYTLSGFQFNTGPPQTMFQSFTSTSKQRIRATPFGFGLDLGGFTNRQWAIIGALGLSRTGVR